MSARALIPSPFDYAFRFVARTREEKRLAFDERRRKSRETFSTFMDD